MINILIRTSYRPKQFKRCVESVLNQTVDANILVSYDDDRALSYIQKYKCKAIKVRPAYECETYWNLYLNHLIRSVHGHCIILDDDDYLAHSGVLHILENIQASNSALYVFKMQWSNGRVIPEPEHFNKTPFTRKHIGMPCVLFHSKLIDNIQFDGNRAGDFRFFNAALDYVDKVCWLDEVLIKIGNIGVNGEME